MSRRGLLSGAAAMGAGAALGSAGLSTPALAQTSQEDRVMGLLADGMSRFAGVPSAEPTMQYEVRRTNQEWLERLTAEEYFLLRQGGTEEPKSSDWWDKPASDRGVYRCKGCDLLLYLSEHKRVLDKGWVFFRHSDPDAVLTGIDQARGNNDTVHLLMEAHCRRCGSHLGHIVHLAGEILHCINGKGLSFQSA